MIDRREAHGPCPSSIPWDVIAPYEGQAKANHDQTLQRLAERGGLSPMEAFMVMTGRSWRGENFTDDEQKKACAFIDTLVRESKIAELSRQIAALVEYAEATQYWRMEPFDQQDRRAHLEKIKKLGVVIRE